MTTGTEPKGNIVSSPLRICIALGVQLGLLAGALLPTLYLTSLIVANPNLGNQPIVFALTEFANNIAFLLFGTFASALAGAILGIVLGSLYGIIITVAFIVSRKQRGFLRFVSIVFLGVFTMISGLTSFTVIAFLNKVYSVTGDSGSDSMAFIGASLAGVFTIIGGLLGSQKLTREKTLEHVR